MLIVIIVCLFFTIANTSAILLTTNGNGGNNVFCPRELIIVKCTVRALALSWHIGKSSFVIYNKVDVPIFAGPNGEGLHIYMYTAIGRLDFHQNGSYVASSPADSSLDSELHLHLNDANDFVEVTCKDFYQKKKSIKITVFPGMLNLVRVKLFCYCKLIFL